MEMEEAKKKCIIMWKHIRDNITDKAWRDVALEGCVLPRFRDAAIKKYAFKELWPQGKRVQFECFLCEVFNAVGGSDDETCVGCPLNPSNKVATIFSLKGCIEQQQPFWSFVNNIEAGWWQRASRAAQRLITMVEEW